MRKWNWLQLFADGAGAADGASGDSGSATAESGITSAEQENGSDAQSITTPKASFEELLKDVDYKKAYDERVQKAIRTRFRAQKETDDKLSLANEVLAMIAPKYGVSPDDLAALKSHVEKDDSYLEQEAIEKGMPVEEIRQKNQMKQENLRLKQQLGQIQQREETARKWQALQQQAAEFQKEYPKFNLQAEVENEKTGRTFFSLLEHGIPLKQAFHAIHGEELVAEMGRLATQRATEQVAASVRANGNRPIENGMSSQSTAQTRVDPKNLTDAQLKEYRDRVMRGEVVSFTR